MVSGWKSAIVQPDGSDENDGGSQCTDIGHLRIEMLLELRGTNVLGRWNSTTAHQCIDGSPELSRGSMLRLVCQ